MIRERLIRHSEVVPIEENKSLRKTFLMNQNIQYDVCNNYIAVRPRPSNDEIKKLLLNCFGLEVDPDSKLKELDSYSDRNYKIEGKLIHRGNELDKQYNEFNKFVLKLFNADSTSKQKWFEDINKIMTYCYHKCGNVKLVLPVYGLDNSSMAVLCEIPLQEDVDVIGCSLSLKEIASKSELITVRDGIYYVKHMARLSVYIPGVEIDIENVNDELAYNYGKAVAVLSSTLKDVTGPEVDIQENFIWNLVNVINNDFRNPYVNDLTDVDKKRTIDGILEKFKMEILPKLKTLPKQWIHGDLSDQNILRHEFENCNEIAGLLDFDDMVYSYRVIEIATSLMNITTTPTVERCIDLARYLYKGYLTVICLSDVELECVFNLMLVRCVMICCIGTYEYKYVDPENDYLLRTVTTGWKTMTYLLSLGEDEFLRKLQE